MVNVLLTFIRTRTTVHLASPAIVHSFVCSKTSVETNFSTTNSINLTKIITYNTYILARI